MRRIVFTLEGPEGRLDEIVFEAGAILSDSTAMKKYNPLVAVSSVFAVRLETPRPRSARRPNELGTRATTPTPRRRKNTMSDTYGDYGGGDTSASEVMFGAGPAEPIYDEPEQGSPEYDAYLENQGDPDEYRELEQLPADLAEEVAEAMRNGASSAEAMMEARQRADTWWQAYQARTAYEQHVQEHAMYEEAYAEADELLAEAAREHGIPSSAVDNGFLRDVANALHAREEQIAYDRGDVERLEWLRGPAGAEAAIEEAARRTGIAAFAMQAHKGLGREGFTESEARARAEFDRFAARSGLVSVRGVG